MSPIGSVWRCGPISSAGVLCVIEAMSRAFLSAKMLSFRLESSRSSQSEISNSRLSLSMMTDRAEVHWSRSDFPNLSTDAKKTGFNCGATVPRSGWSDAHPARSPTDGMVNSQTLRRKSLPRAKHSAHSNRFEIVKRQCEFERYDLRTLQSNPGSGIGDIMNRACVYAGILAEKQHRPFGDLCPSNGSSVSHRHHARTR
jgi:hypothetical protein